MERGGILVQAYQTSSPGDASLARDLLRAGRYYLGGRRGLLILGSTIVVAGLVSSWSWLVAAGVAPLLLSVLPCVAMCALGLCMNRIAGGSSDGQQSATHLGVPIDD